MTKEEKLIASVENDNPGKYLGEIRVLYIHDKIDDPFIIREPVKVGYQQWNGEKWLDIPETIFVFKSENK